MLSFASMKFVALLFSFYLIFLAIEPGLKAVSIIKGKPITCCSDTQCEPFDKKEPINHTENDKIPNACNPFQFCKCCSFVNREMSVLTDVSLTLFSSVHLAYKENVPPQISLEFWQPPKIA